MKRLEVYEGKCPNNFDLSREDCFLESYKTESQHISGVPRGPPQYRLKWHA